MSGVRILGIGSPSGDDQAGWLTVDALLTAGLDHVQIEKLDRPGANLISLMENASRVILIDAMQGNGGVGEIRYFDENDWPAYSEGLSSHGFGLLAALTLARELGCLPPRLDLYGIEIGSALPGEAPSGAVQAAIHRLAAIIADGLPTPPA